MDNPLLTDTNVPPLGTQQTPTPAGPTPEQPPTTPPVDPQFLANQTVTVEPDKKFQLNSSLVVILVFGVFSFLGLVGGIYYFNWQKKQNTIALTMETPKVSPLLVSLPPRASSPASPLLIQTPQSPKPSAVPSTQIGWVLPS